MYFNLKKSNYIRRKILIITNAIFIIILIIMLINIQEKKIKELLF